MTSYQNKIIYYVWVNGDGTVKPDYKTYHGYVPGSEAERHSVEIPSRPDLTSRNLAFLVLHILSNEPPKDLTPDTLWELAAKNADKYAFSKKE